MKQLIENSPKPATYKRGEFYTINGIRLQYTKMQKGNYCFKEFPGNKRYQLNKAGFLIPA